MALVRYAGWDPSEDRLTFGHSWRIDQARAIELREQGYTWAKIAQVLSDEAGNEVSYAADAVAKAVRRARNAERDDH